VARLALEGDVLPAQPAEDTSRSKAAAPPRRPEDVGLDECVAFAEEMVRRAEKLDPRRSHAFRPPGSARATWATGRDQVTITRRVLEGLKRGDPMFFGVIRAWVVRHEKVAGRKKRAGRPPRPSFCSP
jgi:hypothetical protein